MKNKNSFRVILLVGSMMILFIVLYYHVRTFQMKTENIIKVTVQYKLNTVTLDKPDELQEFKKHISGKKFTLHGSAIGAKGWVYWIKCYGSNGVIRYNFTIQNENEIINHEMFFKSEDSMNLNYLKELFSK